MLPNETCDTAFESLDVILLNMKSFGYHTGTNGTQKCAYVIDKHIKLNRLERVILNYLKLGNKT